MNDRVSASLLDRRSPALLSAVFSAVALLLIAVGTYGVLSYAVAQRHREIALRIALGAQPGVIERQFLFLAVRLLAAGGVLGLAGAWAAGRGLGAILFHVPPHSPAVLATAGVTVAAVALAACLIPAIRAARISPMQALNNL